jgi:hypothetical protein
MSFSSERFRVFAGPGSLADSLRSCREDDPLLLRGAPKQLG